MPSRPSRPSRLEFLTALHVGLFLAATTWAFGGNADWVKAPLAAFGSLGLLLTLAAALGTPATTGVDRTVLFRLWPLAFYNLLALVSLATPGFRVVHSGPDTLLLPLTIPSWRPVAALPAEVAEPLWLFDVIYLSCFNLLLIVRHRQVLRGLLLFVVGNAVVLAVFGSLQKLSHASGLYFGLVKSPQANFFASFIYHNHWGAFAVLVSAMCVGLVRHYGRIGSERGFFYSLGFGMLVGLVFLAASVPLSGSRSCTLLLGLLLAGAFGHWLIRLARRRHSAGESAAAPVGGAIVAVLLAVAAIWLVERETISARLALTRAQVASLQTQNGLNSRLTLYRDTWRMAAERPWFGWGIGSYPYVFQLYSTQEPDPRDHLPKFYHDAHNDWLQALAEHGFIGTALLGLCGLVPLCGLRRQHLLGGTIPLFLFTGCGCLLLYAWLEFPFGNVAVVLLWWLSFFTATRYQQLQRPERT